jgi:RHS repeat-associated protein
MEYLGQTGQLSRRNIKGGASTDWTYGSSANDRRLAAINHHGAARDFRYTTTPENLITQIDETGGTAGKVWDYSYDDDDRVIQASSSRGAQYDYRYDPANNITSLQSPATTSSGTYNAVNQIISFGGVSFIYDANGNVTDDGDRTYKWDAENRLIGVALKAQPARATTFRYDGFGRRIAILATNGTTSVETRYLWCGKALCQARAANDAVLRRYYPEGEVIATSGTPLYYAQDQLGSVRDVMPVHGKPLASFEYDPYGNLTETEGLISTDFRYAGMFYEQNTGLYLTQYRVYDSRIARWLSRDPIGPLGGVNPYAYTGNSPVDLKDPNGTLAIGVVVGGFFGGISGAAGAYAQGGSLGDAVVAGLFGAATGAAIGLLDPSEGIGTIALISGASGAVGDIIGQLYSNGGNFNRLDPYEIAGAGVGSAIGGGLGAEATLGLQALGYGEWAANIGGGIAGFIPSAFGGALGKNFGNSLDQALQNASTISINYCPAGGPSVQIWP